jgi:hypothetical protein
MRCDKEVTGWSAVKQFLRSGSQQANVRLSAPSAQDVQDWGCSPAAPEVRLVRNVSANARVRVMATNLDPVDFPWECFGELYHKRWRIEEAFKRLKHHMKLEAASGLSQQAVIVAFLACWLKFIANQVGVWLAIHPHQKIGNPSSWPLAQQFANAVRTRVFLKRLSLMSAKLTEATWAALSVVSATLRSPTLKKSSRLWGCNRPISSKRWTNLSKTRCSSQHIGL